MTAPTPRANPYVGPRAFERGEQLFGRDQEVANLVDLVIAERIVLLYSPSGAGKTSLLRASLAPQLEEEGFRVLPEIRVAAEVAADGAPPRNRYLTSALLSLESDVPANHQRDFEELARMTLADYLTGRSEEGGNQVLILDQFEELLTVDVTDQDEKATFMAELGAALRDRRRWAVIAMREDLVAGLDPFLRSLPTRLRTRFRLDLLGEAAALTAIQGPARKEGVDFTDAAARRLVNDLRTVRVPGDGGLTEVPGPYIEPVQLQVVCRRLWDQPRDDASQITVADITDVGDVDHALACYYAAMVHDVATETGVREGVIRDWFGRELISERGLRSQVVDGPADSTAVQKGVLRRLVSAHLVRAEDRRGTRWYELAHDRLIEPVRQSNAEWREANLQPFQRQAALWHTEHRADHLLLTGGALAEADRWVAQHPDEPTPVEREFLAASHARSKLQRRQRRLVIAIITLICIGLVTFGGLYYQLRQRLHDQRAAEAMLLLQSDPADALAKAFEATGWPHTSKAQVALTSALTASHMRVKLDHGQSVESAAFSPDGRLVLTADMHGTPRVWDAATGHPRRTPTIADKNVLSARWSPDGAHIVTVGADGGARVWDATTGAPGPVLSQGGYVFSARWSPDGAHIVTVGADDTARVWRSASGTEAGPPLSRPDLASGSVVRLSDAVFSPDGSYLAVGGHDGKSRLWEWRTGNPPVLLDGDHPAFSSDGRVLTVDGKKVHIQNVGGEEAADDLVAPTDVNIASFSQDNAYVAGGGEDGTIWIWDVASRSRLVELRGHRGRVTDVVFGPTHPPSRLAVVSASQDGTARVWDAYIGQVLRQFKGPLRSASFSADGTLVVGAGQDGCAWVWRATTGKSEAEFCANSEALESAAFSPDGRYIVTGGSDGIARVWERRTRRKWESVRLEGGVNAVAFDHSGKSVVIAGSDHIARIWKWETAKPPRLLRGHGAAIQDAEFSPDGSRVVTASFDQTAWVWDAVTGKPLHKLDGHAKGVQSAAFRADGRFIVTASLDKTAKIWDAATGLPKGKALEGHENPLLDAEFSPNGRYIVTGAEDGITGIWDAGTGQPLALLPTFSKGVSSSRFSPDGRVILTASLAGIARLDDCAICAPIADLRKLACDRLPEPMRSQPCERGIR
ncbi:MAG: hypothetical protein ACRDYA_11070 [Egibacteraceae bacterium]